MTSPIWTSWTCTQVGDWLESRGLQKYRQVFQENEIAGDILPALTHNVLKDDFGISAFGPRHRILSAIKELTSAPPTATTPSTISTTTNEVLEEKVPVTTPKASSVHTEEETETTTPPVESELHLAVLHAAPLGSKHRNGYFLPMEKLDLEAERRSITDTLLSDMQHKAIHVRFDVGTPDILRSLMTAWKCRVLHFSGHGIGSRPPALVFEDGTGLAHPISADTLRRLTFSGRLPSGDSSTSPTNSQHLQLVFVNSCHSERVASVFVHAGIQHVIAVHSDSLVVDGTATMFAKHFYLSLFSGDTVKTAFEIAKAAVSAQPHQKRAACCCAHLHEPNCSWVKNGQRHSQHSSDACCCKGHALPFPHDESSKFLLLGGDGSADAHEVALFKDLPNGELVDHTPHSPSFIPSMHGLFIGRHYETSLLVKSLLRNPVTTCMGAPGIGKSSLAISVAHFVHNRHVFPDGVFYVDLEGHKPSTLRYAIVHSAGLAPADTDEALFAALSRMRCVLVLDKLEEVLDDDEPKCLELLSRMLSAAHHLRLLIVSRRMPHLPNYVNTYELSLEQLPTRQAMELVRLGAPSCSPANAERLAQLCGCLPLAIRVVGRALTNSRMILTPEQMIQYLEMDERRFENIKNLNQAGQKECIDRCIGSSFCHLDEPLQLAFLAFGFFRCSFDLAAATAVLSPGGASNGQRILRHHSSSGSSSDMLGSTTMTVTTTSTTSPTSLFPSYAYGRARSRAEEEDVGGKNLGAQLSLLDSFNYEFQGVFSSEGYDLLDGETSDEVKARDVAVPLSSTALKLLRQWSLVEYDRRLNKYRMHNLVQLFAKKEANRLDDDIGQESWTDVETPAVRPSSPVQPRPTTFPLGKELVHTWKRRFVRYYCLIVSKASHAYRFDGVLEQFDRERANIDSALGLAAELTTQSLEQTREAQRQKQVALEEDSLLPTMTASGTTASSVTVDESESSSSTSVDASIVDALLHSNLVVRARYIFRARVEPRRRIQVLSTCLQLSKEVRALNCSCGSPENEASRLLWDVEEAKFDRELWVLDEMPSYETQQEPSTKSDACLCTGIRELIALETMILTDLGYACSDVNDYVAAEYHYLEAMRLQCEVLGWSENVQVAEVLNQFGICLSTRSGSTANNSWLLYHAERLLKGGLHVRERVLGDTHPEYATSLNNLANFYKNFGTSSTQAKGRLLGRSKSLAPSGSSFNDGEYVHMSSNSLDDMDVDCSRTDSDVTSSTDSNSIFNTSDDSDQPRIRPDAENLYRLSLKIREQKLGSKHPQVGASLNNLATHLSHEFSKNSSKMSDAIKAKKRAEIGRLFARALDIRKTSLGNASLETAATLSNMGNFKRMSGDYAGAEADIKQALHITDQYYTGVSPRSARYYINLAKVYKEQSRFRDAAAQFAKARDIRQEFFPDPQDVGYCIQQMGKCLQLAGEKEESERLLREAKELRFNQVRLAQADGAEMNAAEHIVDHVDITDVLPADVLAHRKFKFAGRLIGQSGINIKRIEAITCAQVHYSTPNSKKVKKTGKEEHEAPSTRIRITGATPQMVERAKEQCVALIKDIKIRWENFQRHGGRRADDMASGRGYMQSGRGRGRGRQSSGSFLSSGGTSSHFSFQEHEWPTPEASSRSGSDWNRAKGTRHGAPRRRPSHKHHL